MDRFYPGRSLSDHGLQGVYDVNAVDLIDARNCVLATTAVQYKIQDQFYLHIDERLFFHSAHSEWSKGVLLLHEYLYRFVREQGQVDSRNTRKMVGKLISNDPGTLILDIVRLSKNLGFMKYENENSLGFYYKMAPVKAFADAVWWARFGASIEYDHYNMVHASPLQEAQLLLRAMRIESDPETVGQAIAYLKDRTYDARVEPVLQKLRAYHEGRAGVVMTVLKEHMESQRSEIELPYLKYDELRWFHVAIQAMLNRFDNLLNATLTKEQIEFKRNGTAGIRFDFDTGAYTFEDLDMHAIIGGPGRARERNAQIEAANEWLRANIRFTLLGEVESVVALSGITFPIFE